MCVNCVSYLALQIFMHEERSAVLLLSLSLATRKETYQAVNESADSPIFISRILPGGHTATADECFANMSTTTMYALSPIQEIKAPIDLPTRMYKLPPIQGCEGSEAPLVNGDAGGGGEVVRSMIPP